MSTDDRPKDRRPSVRRYAAMKERGERIAVLTAYDVFTARVLEAAGVDLILVGDSLAQVALGFDSTLPVTLDEMLHHARAVRRGAPESFVVMDLPFMSFQSSTEEALRAAGRALKEGRVEGVKLEGGDPRTAATVQRMVEAGIPVMGHVGLTPQSVNALGGYRVQGRDPGDADRIRKEARRLEDAGCFAVVLELVPGSLASGISQALTIPTVGIGAGAGCDGQVLVTSDALGMNPDFEPRFLKRFADLRERARDGVEAYVREVRSGDFPGDEHTFE